jgi:hypothetical protein
MNVFKRFVVKVGNLLGDQLRQLGGDLAEVFCISAQNMDKP